MSTKINRIAFATQKGGAGKSTVATLLASYLYFVRDHRVILIDADHPQHSIKRVRNLETQEVKRDEALQQAFLRTGKEHVYLITDSPLDHVFQRPAPDRPSTFEKAAHPRFAADTVVIDTPGSVAVGGLRTVLENVDRVVVPLEPERMSLMSAVQFLGALQKLTPPGASRSRPIAFWNKIRPASHRQLMEAHRDGFERMGVHVLENYLPYSVKLKRAETVSTIMPVDFRSLDLSKFMEELYTVTQ